jgi:ferredoxin-NADP reductase
VFDIPELKRFDFVPGQFVSLSGPVAGRKITRAYSICSTPDRNRFELCLNRVTEGVFSPFLFEMTPGDTVPIKGPTGFFVIRRPETDMIMVAAGTGIAPYRSMIPQWLAQGGSSSCTLIFGVRYEQTMLYREEWEGLAAAYANFHFWPTLSRPDEGWKGRSGHVQAHLAEALALHTQPDVYVCGLKAMVDDVRTMLKGCGFERHRIVYEKYD